MKGSNTRFDLDGPAFSILLTLVLTIGVASAQVVMGTFTGTVRDASGAVVPGVDMTIRNLATGVTFVATTDHLGNYTVSFLDPGNYSVTAELQGFKTAREP